MIRPQTIRNSDSERSRKLLIRHREQMLAKDLAQEGTVEKQDPSSRLLIMRGVALRLITAQLLLLRS